MSDAPNFNPNGNLSGNWNQLEVVRSATLNKTVCA
jgi:hypothetical protein